MMLSKTKITNKEASDLANFGHKTKSLIGFEFAKEGDPKYGVAYWWWFAVKKECKLYIVETRPEGEELKHTLTIMI